TRRRCGRSRDRRRFQTVPRRWSRWPTAATGSLIVPRRGRECPKLPTRDARRMSEPAKVFEDRETPGQWRVEWLDDDGRCELEIFTGHDARRQALRYAMRKYGQAHLEPRR